MFCFDNTCNFFYNIKTVAFLFHSLSQKYNFIPFVMYYKYLLFYFSIYSGLRNKFAGKKISYYPQWEKNIFFFKY